MLEEVAARLADWGVAGTTGDEGDRTRARVLLRRAESIVGFGDNGAGAAVGEWTARGEDDVIRTSPCGLDTGV